MGPFAQFTTSYVELFEPLVRWGGQACAFLAPVILFALKVIVVMAIWRAAKAIQTVAETYRGSKAGPDTPAKAKG